jgi:hypothetical protein
MQAPAAGFFPSTQPPLFPCNKHCSKSVKVMNYTEVYTEHQVYALTSVKSRAWKVLCLYGWYSVQAGTPL